MVIVPIRGLHFYEAERLYAQGGLTAGLRVTLVRDLSNAFDHHAVQVRLTTTRALLGHIPREHSQLFSAAIDGKTILDAVIMDVEKSGKYLTAKIRVTHREVSKSSFSPAAAPKTDLRHYARTDRGAQSAVVNKKKPRRDSSKIDFAVLPACSGLYCIENIDNGRAYIGSTKNIRERATTHFRELADGTHHNQELMADYRRYGQGRFRIAVVIQADFDLLALEAAEISTRLVNGVQLYNATDDGQGYFNPKAVATEAKGIANLSLAVESGTQPELKSSSKDAHDAAHRIAENPASPLLGLRPSAASPQESKASATTQITPARFALFVVANIAHVRSYWFIYLAVFIYLGVRIWWAIE